MNSYIRKFDNLYEMDKLLRRHKLPKRNQEEMENLNKSTILKKNQLVIKIPGGEKKAQAQMASLVNCTECLKIEPQASINSSKREKLNKRECFPLYDYEGTMNAENIHGFAQAEFS